MSSNTAADHAEGGASPQRDMAAGFAFALIALVIGVPVFGAAWAYHLVRTHNHAASTGTIVHSSTFVREVSVYFPGGFVARWENRPVEMITLIFNYRVDGVTRTGHWTKSLNHPFAENWHGPRRAGEPFTLYYDRDSPGQTRATLEPDAVLVVYSTGMGLMCLLGFTAGCVSWCVTRLRAHRSAHS